MQDSNGLERLSVMDDVPMTAERMPGRMGSVEESMFGLGRLRFEWP